MSQQIGSYPVECGIVYVCRGIATLGVVLLTVAGCGAVPTLPDDLPLAIDQGAEQGSDDSAASSGDGSADAISSEFVTQQTEEAVKAVINAAEAMAVSVAAILPVKDLQAVFEGGVIPAGCPDLSMEPDSNVIPLVLDYGSGCSPASYRDLTFFGTVDGTAYIAVNAFEFSYSEFSAGGVALQGTITGSFITSGDKT